MRRICTCLRPLNADNVCENPRCHRNKTSTKKTRGKWTKALKDLLKKK